MLVGTLEASPRRLSWPVSDRFATRPESHRNSVRSGKAAKTRVYTATGRMKFAHSGQIGKPVRPCSEPQVQLACARCSPPQSRFSSRQPLLEQTRATCTMPISYSRYIGTAMKDCEIASGGVRKAATTKMPEHDVAAVLRHGLDAHEAGRGEQHGGDGNLEGDAEGEKQQQHEIEVVRTCPSSPARRSARRWSGTRT